MEKLINRDEANKIRNALIDQSISAINRRIISAAKRGDDTVIVACPVGAARDIRHLLEDAGYIIKEFKDIGTSSVLIILEL